MLSGALGAALTLRKGVGPAWASGTDLWKDFAANIGNMPTVADTHAASIYAPNAAGVYAPFAANVLTRTDLGLQTVPTRTNSIRNNSNTGVALGTSGTMPTNWQTVTTGLTRTIVATGTENGLPYIDLRFQGTTGGTSGSIIFESGQGIAAVNGQTWAGSCSVSLVGGSLTNVDTQSLTAQINDSGGSFLANQGGGASLTGLLTATPVRFSGTTTIANASTAYIQPKIVFGWSSGVAVDFTLRLAAPQYELGAFATPPILTTSAAATVNGNQQVIDLTGKLGSGVAGVVQVNVLDAVGRNFTRLMEINDGGGTNRITLTYVNGNVQMYVATANAAQAALDAAAWTGGIQTFAFAVGPNFAQFRKVGVGALTADNSVSYPVMTQLVLGGAAAASSQFDTGNDHQYTRKLALSFGAQNQTTFDAMYARAVLAAAA